MVSASRGKATEQEPGAEGGSAVISGRWPVEVGDVLIVEDEEDIARLIQLHLTREGFETRVAGSGRAAIEAMEEKRPAMVLLDIMLPDLDGLEVCRRMKSDAALGRVPIVMVTARGEESEIVEGLELGADDYVTKPFSPRVLMARVRAVFRRRREEESGRRFVVCEGALVIDDDRHKVWVDGEHIDLTVTQYGILRFLAQQPGFVRTRRQIVGSVWGQGAVLSSRAVDVHVAALRQRLGERGNVIETIRGVGYRLTEQPAE